MSVQTAETYIVWISSTDRIASFRKVDGYEEKLFTTHAFFMDFLNGLQMQGYRFQ